MSKYTEKLNLFKYDTKTDGKQTFNVTKALNENWDKIDTAVNERQLTENLSQILDDSTDKYPSNNAVKTAIDEKDSLPPQEGNKGKFLTTDGEAASWDYVNTLPIGSVYPCICSDGWTPENALPCNGAEYSKSQFSDLWTNYLQPAVYNPKPFNIVGSPEISADGVVNGLSTNNTNRVDLPIDLTNATSFTLELDMQAVHAPSDDQITGVIVQTKGKGYPFYCYCGAYINSNFGFDLQLRNSDGLVNRVNGTFVKGNVAKIKWELKDNVWSISLYKNETLLKSVEATQEEMGVTLGEETIWLSPSQQGWNIDLKTVKLVVDGKTVINGSQPRLATCTYEEYESDIEAYGQCAKFAVDEENGTFRVPTIKDGAYITQALSAEEIGKSYNESLPNIAGTIQPIPTNGFAAEGVFYQKEGTTGTVREDSGAADYIVGFDASRASSAYQNGAKVQGDNVRLRYFVVVATGAINQSAMDWSEWATSLDGKMNISASNISAVGKSALAGLSMPSNKYDSLSIGSSGTAYTAPADGWFCFRMYCASSGFVGLFYPETDPDTEAWFATSHWSTKSQSNVACYLPAKKGQQVLIAYSGASVKSGSSFLKFVYAEGNSTESEE